MKAKGRLLTTAEVADRLALSEHFVREHAGELGGIRAGGGSRAPLRFPPEMVDAWIEAHRLAPDSVAVKPKPLKRNPQRARGIDLLPPAPEGLLSAKG